MLNVTTRECDKNPKLRFHGQRLGSALNNITIFFRLYRNTQYITYSEIYKLLQMTKLKYYYD